MNKPSIRNKNVMNKLYIRNMYVYQHKNWPQWKWDQNEVNQLLISLIGKQNHFLGKLEGLGFDVREKTALESEIKDILNNSEIEGNPLQESQIRSSIAKNLGIDEHVILAIVVGIFLHISTTIIFETSENHKFNLLKLVSILVGCSFAFGLNWI